MDKLNSTLKLGTTSNCFDASSDQMNRRIILTVISISIALLWLSYLLLTYVSMLAYTSCQPVRGL